MLIVSCYFSFYKIIICTLESNTNIICKIDIFSNVIWCVLKVSTCLFVISSYLLYFFPTIYNRLLFYCLRFYFFSFINFFSPNRERQKCFAFSLTRYNIDIALQVVHMSFHILRHNFWPAVMILLIGKKWH